MNLFRNALCAATVVFAAAPASAALIDFESLANNTIVTNQFAGVTFSSSGSSVNKVTSQPGIGFGNNFLCTAASAASSINCTDETILTFATGVENLSFWQVGDNLNGVAKVAEVDVFVGGVFNSTVDIFGDSNFNNPNLVDLTTFTNVTSIRIHSITDGGGLGWDNFRFEEVSNVVPLPAGFVLLASAMGALGLVRRRRKT